jgi:hypothetical protein
MQMSRELTKEIITVTAGENPFHYLQESYRVNIISNTNSINKQFHDELENGDVRMVQRQMQIKNFMMS